MNFKWGKLKSQATVLIAILFMTTIPIFSPVQGETNIQGLNDIAQEARDAWEAGHNEIYYSFINSQSPELQRLLNNPDIQLMYIDENGSPLFYSINNLNSARTISTDNVWPNGSAGLNLSGQNMAAGEVGIWDAGSALLTHQEFNGRVTLGANNSPTTHYHATHVAGTMVAGGFVASARGMAFSAPLVSRDWVADDTEMPDAAQNGMIISNHSYGVISGWFDERDPVTNAHIDWWWHGDLSISTVEDFKFGFYGNAARTWDNIAVNAPNYLIIKAAGNDRGDSPPQGTQYWLPTQPNPTQSTDPRDADGGTTGYDTIVWRGSAKNIITVGAVNDIPGGYMQSADVVMTGFSGWGPTDDGRIKPDVVANGIELNSAMDTGNDDYDELSGTSMATPSVSGSAILLYEHYQATHNDDLPLSSTIKALIINTTDEAGLNDGPDYQFGWGLMNTESAAELILDDETSPGHLVEAEMENNDTIEYYFQYSGLDPIKITMCWIDPAGTSPNPSLNPTDRILVNDLDMVLSRISDDVVAETHSPYRLDPTPARRGNPATTGDNDRDNVEQIFVNNRTPGLYRLTINHKGDLNGDQTLSIASTEALRCRISGHVLASNSIPIQDATVGGLPGNPVTDDLGAYSVDVPYHWTGTVSPSKGSIIFQPETRDYSEIDRSFTEDDYTGKQGAIAYVIDRSGSMGGIPINVAKFAANLGITFMKGGSDVAVISFSTSASTDYQLTTITSNAVRSAARGAVDNIGTGGGTSIGSGMIRGCEQISRSLAPSRDYIVLSDGQQNTPPSPADALASSCFQNLNPLSSVLALNDVYRTPVHTIAFGTGADQALLASIAAQTGGIFLYVPSRNEPLALADLYLTIQGNISGEQRIGEFEEQISAPDAHSHNFTVSGDISEQTVTLVWDDANDNMDLTLVSPDGVQINASNAQGLGITFVGGPAIEYFTIPSPEQGQWTAHMTAISGSTNYALILSGQSTIEMDVDFDRDEYPLNAPITVLATLNEGEAPITGATMTADVLSPTAALAFFNSMYPATGDVDPVEIPGLVKSSDGLSYLDDQGNALYSTTSMTLYDDGAHNDGVAGDGVYANQYTNTASLGTYSFNVHASGTSPSGTDFTRDARLATVVTVTANAPPVADAGDNQTVECTGTAGAVATLDGSDSSDIDGDPLTYTWYYEGALITGPSSDATATHDFGFGDHMVQLTVDDGMGGTATDEVMISVVDTTPPEITVTVSPEVLWPPNHKMVDIEYTVAVSDICDDMVMWELVDLTSNEPDNGTGDGDTADDIQGAEFGTMDTNVSLRAERAGMYNGRVYQATFQATDSHGNTSVAMAMVHVPHDNNDIGTILSSGSNLPTMASDVVFMVPGSSLWRKKTPAQMDNVGDPSRETVRVIEPISANICNTAGVIYPTAFFTAEIDNDGHQDVLMAFNRRSLITLNTVSTEEDGIPVLALEIGEELFIIMEMDDIQNTELDLNGLINKMRSDGEIDDSLVLGNSESGLPRQAGLIGAAPNPFNPSTTISYYIPDSRHVDLSIFDISGRLVDRLVSQTMTAGEYSVVWHGTDSRGSRVASGVYFYRMTAGSLVDTKRMILIK